MAKRTPAQIRKSLRKPASELSASELDTRREIIAAGRQKTKGGKKKNKGRVNTIGGVAKALKRRGATFE